MVVTNSEELAARLRSLRAHGTKTHKYMSEEQGWNSRLDGLQAAILRVKLRHLDAWAEGRRENAARYNKLLGGVPGVVTPVVAPWAEHVYHQYTIRVPQRDTLQKTLAEQGIPTTVYYPVPMHQQGMYKSLPQRSLPVSEKAAAEVVSLPIYPELTGQQIERVVQAIHGAARS